MKFIKWFLFKRNYKETGLFQVDQAWYDLDGMSVMIVIFFMFFTVMSIIIL